eukprot:m.627352 g.627352  ORF g.627352 m.627352 type:complete len:684 (-) comp22556_c0_seq6:220-2271(-)
MSRTPRYVPDLDDALAKISAKKPPVSRSMVEMVVELALVKYLKYYKQVVHSIEKFVHKARSEYKVPGLYLIDAIVQSSQRLKDKRLYTNRFAQNLPKTFETLLRCGPEDQERVMRVVKMWKAREYFPADVMAKLLPDKPSASAITQLAPGGDDKAGAAKLVTEIVPPADANGGSTLFDDFDDDDDEDDAQRIDRQHRMRMEGELKAAKGEAPMVLDAGSTPTEGGGSLLREIINDTQAKPVVDTSALLSTIESLIGTDERVVPSRGTDGGCVTASAASADGNTIGSSAAPPLPPPPSGVATTQPYNNSNMSKSVSDSGGTNAGYESQTPAPPTAAPQTGAGSSAWFDAARRLQEQLRQSNPPSAPPPAAPPVSSTPPPQHTHAPPNAPPPHPAPTHEEQRTGPPSGGVPRGPPQIRVLSTTFRVNGLNQHVTRDSMMHFLRRFGGSVRNIWVEKKPPGMTCMMCSRQTAERVKAMLPLTPAVRAQLDAAAVTQCMGMQSNTDEPLTSVWLPGVGQGKLGQEWNAATGVSYIPLSVVCKGNIAEICNGAVVDRDTAPPDMCTDLNAHEAPGAEYRASQNPTAPPHAATRTAPAHPPRWRGDAGPPQGPPPGPPPAQGRQAPPAQFGGAYGGAPPPRPPVHAPSAPGPNSGMATYERAPGSSLAPGGEEPRSRKRKSRWSDTRPV